MTLKQAILSNVGRDGLKKLIAEFGLQVDLRSPEQMRAALLRERSAVPSQMLPHLSNDELTAVCGQCGVQGGRRRHRLIEDLLQADAQPRLPRRQGSGLRFVAIDFETADYYRDSACSVALVRIEDERVVDRQHHLIRPPRRKFFFSYLHGITWRHVADQPTFAELWPRIAPSFQGVQFVAAHNAPFDRSVLRACCSAAGLPMPTTPFLCTVRLARQAWDLDNARLPTVCQHLRIPLHHHHAGSDAEACAQIVLSARKQRPHLQLQGSP